MKKHFPAFLVSVLLSASILVSSSAAASSFSDVPQDAWYAGAVAYCVDAELMHGTSATTFSPDATTSRVKPALPADTAPSALGRMSRSPGNSWRPCSGAAPAARYRIPLPLFPTSLRSLHLPSRQPPGRSRLASSPAGTAAGSTRTAWQRGPRLRSSYLATTHSRNRTLPLPPPRRKTLCQNSFSP